MQEFRFHHVGIVTANSGETVAFYHSLGYEAIGRFDDPCQKSNIVLLHHASSPLLELVEPQSDDSPAMGWVKRVKTNPYHTCYEVDNLDEAISEMKRQKLVAVSKINPAAAFDRRRIIFMWGEACGLIELLEANR